ncbi:MAG: hypothetical protein JWP79_3128 [Polaromonas sp.]|nr:hypothetical protein [Polaromonas sp.]MDB5869826.1 hypothetical protein [Polaromonas sp.]
MIRHNAPPVVYPLGRSSFLGSLLLGLWLAGFFSVMLWCHFTKPMDWRMTLAFLCVAGAGIAAGTSWKNMLGGQLAWNGQVWRWESAGYLSGAAEHEVSVIADFQNMLLLRLENQARAGLWLWVEQGAMPERWLDLRRAVYSPHKSPAASLTSHDLLPAEPSSLPFAAVAVSIVMQPQNDQRAKP